MPCTKRAQRVPCPALQSSSSRGSFAQDAFPHGFRELEDGPEPLSRALNQALQGIHPSSGVSQGVREFVLLLTQIPLAVVWRNALHMGPGRVFLQSCLKAEGA